jgi:ribosomal-protein-serine acetyltransferase
VSPLPLELAPGALLRRLTMDDLGAIWTLVQAERDRVGRWMPWIELTNSIADERAWLETVTADPSGLDGCGIFVEGIYAGGVGLSIGPFGIGGEIGYWIGSAYEGRGLVTAACRALIEIGFRERGLHRITIRAGVENVRSRAIAERLGFVQEGVEREGGRGVGRYYDLVTYGLLEREWRPEG